MLSITDAADIESLRAELANAAGLDDIQERTLEVVGVIEAVAAPLGIHPVIVGGMAVLFWTGEYAFWTADIDVVMVVSDELHDRLAELGLERSADGRHWELPGTEVFVEAPSSALDPEARVKEVSLPSGRVASRCPACSPEEFHGVGHQSVGQQILVLPQGIEGDELRDLEERAASRRVSRVLRGMRGLADELQEGRRKPPESDEFHAISAHARQAEYARQQP